MTMEGVSITEVCEALGEFRTVGVFAGAFVLKDLIQFNAVELSVGVLRYGGNSDIAYLLTVHRIFSLCRSDVLLNSLKPFLDWRQVSRITQIVEHI